MSEKMTGVGVLEESQATLEDGLRARELERRDALVRDDMEALSQLVTEDLVHVHTTGNVHGKSDLLSHAGGFLRFIEVERGPLLIRRLGPDAAVMTGPMTNTVQRRGHDETVLVHAFVTQVWVREEGQWRIARFHAVRLPDST